MTGHSNRTAPIDEPPKWSGEGADLGADPASGAWVRRLTSGPMMNHPIYCEQPYTSPDGKRVAIIRSRDFTYENDFSLLVAEPDTLQMARSNRPCTYRGGTFHTGKCRTLVRDCMSHGIAGGSNWEPVPYFTADNRYVIYNASPFGTNQVHAAKVPPEFLKRLD
jgi:hypothetical protein